MTLYFQEFTSPLGNILLTGNGKAVTGCYFQDQKYFPVSGAQWRHADEDALLNEATQILQAYFACGKLECDIAIAPQGTDFQRKVWDALTQIPAGETRSYGQIAASLGKPGAVRAVAAAIGRNPVSILIPCHRVIGSNGSLTGYAGGLERKAALLKLEGADPILRLAF